MPDPWSVLGVTRNASSDEIKKAYREKAHIHHPDKGGDPEAFRNLTEAYDKIKDYKPGNYRPLDDILNDVFEKYSDAWERTYAHTRQQYKHETRYRYPPEESCVLGINFTIKTVRKGQVVPIDYTVSEDCGCSNGLTPDKKQCNLCQGFGYTNKTKRIHVKIQEIPEKEKSL
jgi:DnaJ-class molecular chaperone